jgi:hypothetical protein
MIMLDDAAAPQMMDPISKIVKKTRNETLLLNLW